MGPHPDKTAFAVLQDKWWILVVAFGVSIVITPIMRFIANRTGIVDRPDALLKPHGRPVAYLGGVGICIGLLAGLACTTFALPEIEERWNAMKDLATAGQWRALHDRALWNLFSIALASIAITIVGLLDDIYKLKPRQKVLGQLAATGIILLGGVGTRIVTVFFSAIGIWGAPDWLIILLSVPTCAFLVIATCNATNLLDGLDGLCGGVTGIIALAFLALAVWLAMWPKPIAEPPGFNELRLGFCLAMAGAVLGFLPYNVPPASIFMGDAGSMLLGFFVASMMAMFCHEGTIRWFIAAWAVFALPTLDTGMAVFRRMWNSKSIFEGDRSHLYDQLVDRGMSVKQVVGLFYLLAALAGATGVCAAIYLRARYAAIFYLGLLAALIIVTVIMILLRNAGKRMNARQISILCCVLMVLAATVAFLAAICLGVSWVRPAAWAYLALLAVVAIVFIVMGLITPRLRESASQFKA